MADFYRISNFIENMKKKNLMFLAVFTFVYVRALYYNGEVSVILMLTHP